MKRRLILSVSLILVFTLTLPFCGSRSSALVYNYNESNALFRTSNAKQAARRLLLKKYYISSAENEEQELLWDFENRLFALCNTLGYEPSEVELEARKEEFFNECCSKAEALGITPEECARQKYLLTVETEDLAIHGKLTPDYFTLHARASLRIDWAVELLAELWGLPSEKGDKEALRASVMEYSVGHSKLVRRQKNPNLFLKKLDLIFFIFSNTGALIPAYAEDEDGYGAVYNKVYGLNPLWLEPYLGDLVAGTSSVDGIYRFRGTDDWDWLIVRRNGEYGLYYFVEWIDAESDGLKAFTSIYGFEPEIKPR